MIRYVTKEPRKPWNVSNPVLIHLSRHPFMMWFTEFTCGRHLLDISRIRMKSYLTNAGKYLGYLETCISVLLSESKLLHFLNTLLVTKRNYLQYWIQQQLRPHSNIKIFKHDKMVAKRGMQKCIKSIYILNNIRKHFATLTMRVPKNCRKNSIVKRIWQLMKL